MVIKPLMVSIIIMLRRTIHTSTVVSTVKSSSEKAKSIRNREPKVHGLRSRPCEVQKSLGSMSHP
jgi:hypothetical protein